MLYAESSLLIVPCGIEIAMEDREYNDYASLLIVPCGIEIC